LWADETLSILKRQHIERVQNMLRVGLIGLGYIGNAHARSIVANSRMQLTAVYARSPEKRALFAEQYGARPEESVEALVSSREVDAVVIASSTDTHSDLAVQVAQAGKPLYCEKPIDLNLVRAKRTVDAIKAGNAPVMIGFNRRYEDSYAAVQRDVETGAVGRLQLLQMTSRGPKNPPSPDYIKTSGGFLRDKGVHFFDLARFITGDEVTEVSAMGAVLTNPFIGEMGDYDTVVVQLRMRGGAFCQIDNTRTAPYGYDERIEAFGSAGMVEASRLPNDPCAGPKVRRC
jgi:myo-inositol 2-dehydrogenase/D-chiro-inositol 1-dehydrogenase